MVSFLNELSFPNAATIPEAIQFFETLGECYKQSRISGIREVKVCDAFYHHQFAPNYAFVHWLSDGTVDQDLRTLINIVTGTLPNAEGMVIGYENDHDNVLHFEYNELPCVGLGLASDAIFDTIAFSIDSQIWNQPEYRVSVTIAKENVDGNVVEIQQMASVKNISHSPHLAIHLGFIQQSVGEAIQSGAELWARKTELFPNLTFLGNVRNQLNQFTANSPGFRQIIDRLYGLQNVALTCTGVPIQPGSFHTHTTPESNNRENMFRNQLTFTCPDGYERLFTWHSRFTPGAGRIHFFPFEAEKKIIVGYIGPKIQ